MTEIQYDLLMCVFLRTEAQEAGDQESYEQILALGDMLAERVMQSGDTLYRPDHAVAYLQAKYSH